MKINKKYAANKQGIEEILDLSEKTLKKYKVNRKETNSALLGIEEAVVCLVDHIKQDGDAKEISVSIRAFLGTVTIALAAEGEAFSPYENMAVSSKIDADDIDDNVKETLNAILLKSYASDFKYHHGQNKNSIRLTIIRSRQAFLYQTLGAMALAVIVGLLLGNLASDSFNSVLNSELLEPIKTMYMNAIKMVVAPVVFFSLVSCVVQFSDLSALGRIGGKVFGMYLFTTILAVGVGIGMFYLFMPGNPEIASFFTEDVSAITSQTVDDSIKNTIVGIIPSDIISPFLNSDMMKLIFMAVLVGVATGLLGEYSKMLIDLFTALNDLFLKITTLIIKVMPVAVFCSILSMMLTMGFSKILSVLGMMGTFIAGLVCMMLIYSLMIMVIGRVNPITFIRKYAPYMFQVFSMSSSNASIPINMECCEKKLGIDRKIFSLSIPLGATLNMDGTCVFLAVFALALAKSYGVFVSGSGILSIIITIVILSMGAPGIPGAGLICLSVLLVQLDVPVGAIGLVIGIESLCGMFRTMNNCLGDVAMTIIVAKSENAIDMNVYNGD